MSTSANKAKENDPIVSALVSVGVLMVPAGFLRWYFYSSFTDFGWRDWVFVFSAPVYFALGAGARFGRQRAGQWMILCGLIHQFFFLEWTLYERSLNPWRDGSLFLLPSLCLLLWAAWGSSERSAVAAGMPILEWKNEMKICLCIWGTTIPLVILCITFVVLKITAESQFALWSAASAAISASILTCSLMTIWPLMKRRRQFKAAKQAAEKAGPA